MGIFLAFLSAVGISLFQITAKKAGKKIDNFWGLIAGYQFISAVILFALCYFEDVKYNLTLLSILMLMLASLVWPVSSWLNLVAVKRLEVSTNTILAQMSLIVIYIGSVIFFSDKLTLPRIGGVLLVIIATGVIFGGKNSLTGITKSGIVLRILASVTYAIACLLDKYNTRNFSTLFYMALTFLFPAFISLAFSKMNVKQVISSAKVNYKHVLILAFAASLVSFTILKSFLYIDTGVAYTIQNFATVITVFAGIILFKETDNIPRKFIGLTMVLTAAYILNFT